MVYVLAAQQLIIVGVFYFLVQKIQNTEDDREQRSADAQFKALTSFMTALTDLQKMNDQIQRHIIDEGIQERKDLINAQFIEREQLFQRIQAPEAAATTQPVGGKSPTIVTVGEEEEAEQDNPGVEPVQPVRPIHAVKTVGGNDG